MSANGDFDLTEIEKSVKIFLAINQNLTAEVPSDVVRIKELVDSIMPILRAWLDMMAGLLQDQARHEQQQFRERRAEYQKGHRRGRPWIHDVRIKATPNGLSAEWLHYKSRYGDTVFSEGIRSDSQFRVPAKNFKPCSAIEKEAIRAAEDQFSALRRATHWLSTLSGAMTAISQMRLVNSRPNTIPFDDPLDCRFGCWCAEPCEEFLRSSPFWLDYFP